LLYVIQSPDGSRVALSTEPGQIYIFDVDSASLTSTFTSHAMSVRSIVWSADSAVRLICYFRIVILAYLIGYVDGQLLLSSSEDKTLTLFDVRASTPSKTTSGAVASFSGHSSWVLSADISPDGRLAVSGYTLFSILVLLSVANVDEQNSSADKTIKVWDIGARAAVSTIQDTGEVWSVKWRPKIGSAGAIVSGGEDGVVKWWRSAGAG
jgi:WD repeat-containing protein 61